MAISQFSHRTITNRILMVTPLKYNLSLVYSILNDKLSAQFILHSCMDLTLAYAFDRLEYTREALLDKISAHDHTHISTRKKKKWSPVEQCYHVYLAENLSRQYCIKKLSFKPELEDAGLKTQLRVMALKAMERLPLKFKAPKNINEQAFPPDLNLETVRQVWAEDRKELKSFLENLDPALLNKEIYKQPSVGRLTIAGMLEFFQFHQDRHQEHIRKIYGID